MTDFDNKYNMTGTICKSPHLDFIKKIKEGMGDNCKLYVEIGVLYGGSMILMMDMPYKCKHIGIDPFTGYYGKSYDPHRGIKLDNHKKIVEDNLLKNNPMKQEWELLEGKSNDLVDYINEPIDLLFIDGDHSYQGVIDDYNNYGKKVRSGGYIIFDNYMDSCWKEVEKAVDEIYDDKIFLARTVYGNCACLQVK